MRVLIGTNNEHKLREFRGILSEHTVLSPAELGLSGNVEETGTTFLENALLKAAAFQALLRDRAGSSEIVVVADDSGLCVDALDGAPGIYSARYGSANNHEKLNSSERNLLLLDELQEVENRSAHFTCCMVGIMGRDRMVIAQEAWYGEVATKPAAASGGFGYDPVFYVPSLGRTAAELEVQEKNRYSHRARAAAVLAAALDRASALP